MKKICMSVFFASALLLGATETMTVSRDGDNIEIRTDFPGGYTLHQTGWAKGPNRQFNFNRVMLYKGKRPLSTVKYSGDDACPWNLNSTYIGANHGDSINSGLIFDQPHGLTEKDCGSKWTDPKGKNFYITKIENPKVVWMLSDNISKNKDIWQFFRPNPKLPLRNADGRELKDFKVQFRQLYSPVRILSRKYLADGKPMQEKATLKCSVFTIEEEYDIIATDAILKHVIANAGRQVAFNEPGLDRFLTQKIVYKFYPDSSCIVTHHVKFDRDVRLGYMGFIQAIMMNKGKYGKYLYYVPKTKPVQYDNQEWDFANMVDFTRPIKGSMYIKAADFENPASMPERFVQYLKDGKGQPDIGFVSGYSLLEGCTTPEEHGKNAAIALFLYKSHKTYPHALDSGKLRNIKAGQTFYCMAYRQYFDPNQGYYLNRQGKYLVMYADFHEPVSGKVIALPEKLRGIKPELVEKSGTVTFELSGDSLKFNSTGKNGYCVLKFEKPE
ncbi:MAG: hypothetical protein IKO93_16305 [Lentisphaeria bacterium]|nr:hypothetical protein [Lentisphaeria bacterium]